MSQPPTKLGPYEIIREIARSNDIVYEAYDGVMNRRVAVKELAIPPGSTGPQVEDRIARFRREAQAVGSLNHPHIMTVYSFAEDGGRWYIAMEYLDGTTLRKLIDDGGTIETERAVDIVSETLDGLGHAHAHGVVHRDIKPDNIQIVSNGGVKITDFGIARLTFQPNLTVDGQVFGTPSYMSPEQIVGRDIDARSDVFSVGAMLYEMLAGVKPFAGDNVVAITYNIVNTPASKPPSVPDAIWNVIERAIDKVPSSRYASALEMRDALRDAFASGLTPVAPAYAPPVATTPWSVAPPLTPPTVGGVPPILGGPQYPGTSVPYPATPYPSVPNPYAMPTSYTNAPIYYPPPPRAPILSPEASRLMGRFFLIFVTIALLFAIGIFAFITIVNEMGKGRAQGGTPSTRSAQQTPAADRSKPKASDSEGESGEATPTTTSGGSGGYASMPIETLRATCLKPDTEACGVLRTRALALGANTRGTRLADAQSLYGDSCAGMAEHAEAVDAYLKAAGTRADSGAGPGEIRREVYAAEDEAKLANDPKLWLDIVAFRQKYNLGDAVS